MPLKRFFVCLVLLSYACLSIFQTGLAGALSPAQKKVYQSGVNWFDVAACTDTPAASAAPGDVPEINTSYDANKINPSSRVIRDLLLAQAATKVPASVLLAQGAQESGDAGWWDKSKMDDSKTLKYSYFNDGGKGNLNSEFKSYDDNANGHGPMQLDNWGGEYVDGKTGNYGDGRFKNFKEGAVGQFGADNSLNPKKIGNIAMMWDTAILYAAVVDADVVNGDPSKATTEQWAQVLSKYGTLYKAPASTVEKWKNFRDKLAPLLDNATVSDTQAKNSGNIGGSVYMLGDSITEGAKDDLETAFKTKNSDLFINASSSRSITRPGTSAGYKTSGLDAIKDDQERIAKAQNVVVALGTNQRDSDFEASIKKLISGDNKTNTKGIKDYNPTANIYWVNVFSDGKGSEKLDKAKINKSIQSLATSEKYQVIDTDGKGIEVGDDKVHPTPAGSKKFAEIVASGIGGSDTEKPKQAGQCTCESDSSATLTGSDNEAKIFNFLVGEMKLKPFQAAGVMGNMKAESGYEPMKEESIYDRKVSAEDFPVSGGGPGFGIVQWTPGSKMIDTFSPKSKADDLGAQLKFLQGQLEGTGPAAEKAAGDKLKATKNVEEANLSFELDYERHKGGVQPQRLENAKDVLARLGSGAGGGESTGSDSADCAEAGSSGLAGGYSLPVDKKIYTAHPDYFTIPHHRSSNGAEDIASDIPLEQGTPVYSMSDGKIIAAPNEGGYGEGVTIDAGDGITFVYGHGLDGGSVKGAKQGDKVKAGQLIMHADNTGSSRGSHLHVTIKVNGTDVCPQTLFVGIAEGKPPDIKKLPAHGCSEGML